MIVRSAPFTRDDPHECDDGKCLEVQHDVNDGFNITSPSDNRLRFYVRDVRGGERVFIKLGSPYMLSLRDLYAVSVTTAIEEARFEQMDAFGKREQHVLLHDIVYDKYPERAHDISRWLLDSFGGSSDTFMVTSTLLREQGFPYGFYDAPSGPIHRCTFRGSDIKQCEIPWYLGEDQDIRIVKVVDGVDNTTSETSEAGPLITDALFDVEPNTMVVQIRDVVLQHPYVGAVGAFGIGWALCAILKRIRKKSRSQRARRRTMAPRAAMLLQEESTYTAMIDGV